ncbi:hypothetical protein [Jiangella alkaliphila]|uniref:Uncharacterized protein n=1 Tax=Jiangella alkaliphila TaxID=419479 RepID=A0A1H2GEM8_9ACTN|nr:hypothetical protein [Jiangella alkaliphila]SDU18113.1 hypothetical protein SAMN04488563_0459 [Jiangella alkaliphila]
MEWRSKNGRYEDDGGNGDSGNLAELMPNYEQAAGRQGPERPPGRTPGPKAGRARRAQRAA